MKPIWFGPKTIGYGASPRGWQGWLVSAAFLGALVCVRVFFHPQDFGLPQWSRAAAMAGLLAVFLAVIALTYGDDAG